MKHVFCFLLLLVFTPLLCFSLSAAADSSASAMDFTATSVSSSGSGWSWDASSKTLTLSGLDIDVARASARDCLYALKLPGGSTIALADGSCNNIVLSASGSCSSYGIYALGSLSITGGGTLSVSVAGASNSNSFGIYAMGAISISGGAHVCANSGPSSRSSSYSSAGVRSLESLTVNGASLNAGSTAGTETAVASGIFVSGCISLTDSSVCAASGETSAESCGIRCSAELSVSGSMLTATAADATSLSAGIYCTGSRVCISGGSSVVAFGGCSSFSAGIMAGSGSIDISGEDTFVTAFGGGEPPELRMFSSNAAAASGVAGGLCGGSVHIDAGVIFAGSSCDAAADGVRGGAISSDGEVAISGGSVTSVSNGVMDVFSISGLNDGLHAENVCVSGGRFNASVAAFVSDPLNFEVDMGDGWFVYFASAEEALSYVGNADGAVITGVGSSAGLRSCVITVSTDGSNVDFTRVLPEGLSFTLPKSPSRYGYIFLGWRGSLGAYDAGATVTVTGDEHFTPIWGLMPSISDPAGETDDSELSDVRFSDVSQGDWFYEAVEFVSSRGLMTGVGSECFSPDLQLSRAMVWTVLARSAGVDADADGAWYAAAQEWVSASGVSDGEDPWAAVTREQLVTMLYRLAGEPYSGSLSVSIPDADCVSSWARDAMAWAVDARIIEGDENGLLSPSATATRAEAAAIFMRWICAA